MVGFNKGHLLRVGDLQEIKEESKCNFKLRDPN